MLLDKWFISRTFQNIKVNFISHQKTAQKENMQFFTRPSEIHTYCESNMHAEISNNATQRKWHLLNSMFIYY